jgi:hypothetical protein
VNGLGVSAGPLLPISWRRFSIRFWIV